MSKHAMGPWHLEETPCSYNRDGAFGRFAVFDKSNDFIIAVTVGDVSALKQIEEANAHLIAAAPELLSALKEMLTAVKFGGLQNLGTEDRPNMGFKCYVPDDFVTIAERAIAKADGSMS